jgi:hypothetical protein
MKKSVLIIGFGVVVGYVLGAHAGRDRYDAIVARADRLWRNPRVARARREAADYAREQAPVIRARAEAVAKAAPGAIADRAKATATAARDVADRTATLAKDVTDRTVSAARDAADKTVGAATDAASRVGEARDSALAHLDDDENDDDR